MASEREAHIACDETADGVEAVPTTTTGYYNCCYTGLPASQSDERAAATHQSEAMVHALLRQEQTLSERRYLLDEYVFQPLTYEMKPYNYIYKGLFGLLRSVHKLRQVVDVIAPERAREPIERATRYTCLGWWYVYSLLVITLLAPLLFTTRVAYKYSDAAAKYRDRTTPLSWLSRFAAAQKAEAATTTTTCRQRTPLTRDGDE